MDFKSAFIEDMCYVMKYYHNTVYHFPFSNER